MIHRFVVTFALFIACAGFAAAAEVRLRSTVICPATIVRLGDIAEIQAEDPAITNELSAIALFPAPRSGASVQLNRHQVRQLLAFSEVDLTAITLTGSDFVVVQTEGAALAVRPARRGMSQTSAIRLASHEVEVPRSLPATAVKPSPTEPIEMPPLVQRGDSVTVHSRTAGVRVTTSGRAMSGGTLGDEIAVELADTRAKILGRIAGPQTIEVTSAQP